MHDSDIAQFLQQNPNVSTIELLISDLNGVLRGKRIERNHLQKVFDQGFYLPGSVMSLDATGTTVEAAGLGMSAGDCDQLCRPIPDTLALVPWITDGSRAQVLCTMYEKDQQPFFADPRQILLNTIKRFNQLGYTAGFAVELEFYLIDPKGSADGTVQPPVSAHTQQRMSSCQVYSIEDLAEHEGFIQAVIAAAHAQGIPADTVIAEYAPGQFEVNLHHDEDILRAVDHAIMLKRVIRNIARQHGMEATFMAKPYLQESGNGMHIHLSLTKHGQNQFADDDPTTNALLRSAVAGILSMADSTQAFLAPNINSYRRLLSESFAPTSKCWGLDNRTVALRIPAGKAEATRIEHRMAGADANPYLVTSALLAGIVEGIQQQLEPPAAITGNAYEQNIEQVADNLRDALRNMDNDPRICNWFGDRFIALFQACKWHDLELFEQQITPMEYQLLLRYS